MPAGYTSPGGVMYRGGGVLGRVPLAGKPEYSLRSKTNSILRLAQEIQGQFRWPGGAFTMGVAAANEDIAIRVQAGMVARLERSVASGGRPQMGRLGKDPHPQGALAAAISNKGNRFANASGWMVGIPSYLDQSPAKRYWRRIESGAPRYWARGWFWDGSGKAGPHAPNPAMARMHARFPQGGARAFDVYVKAFPGYQYTEGGRDVLRATNIVDVYRSYLKAYGVTLTPAMVRAGAARV